MSGQDFTPPGPPLEPAYVGAPASADLPPDPTQWYGHYTPVVHRPGGLAVASLVLAGLAAALDVLMAGTAAAVEHGASNGFVLGSVGYGLMAMVSAVVLIAAYIVTCLWLQQSRQFADVYRPGDPHAYGTGWTWAGWLVPIANFFIPFRVVRDLYRSSRPLPAPIGLVGFWWFLWLGYRVTSFVAGTSDSFTPSQAAATVSAVLSVGAFACWTVIVRRIDSGQHGQELAGAPVR